MSVIGFPLGSTGGSTFPIWARGAVLSEPRDDVQGLPLILIGCHTRDGQAGSAVIRDGGALEGEDEAPPPGRFIGCYSGRAPGGEDVGLCWKASAVGEILASAR